MRRKYVIWLHVAVWLVIWLNNFLPRYFANNYKGYAKVPEGAGLLFNYAAVSLGYLIITIVIFYTIAYLIAPKFLNKKWLQGLLSLLGLLVFIPLYRYILEFHILLPYLNFDNYFGKTPEMIWYIQNSILFSVYSYFTWAIIYFVVKEWYENNKRKKELEKEMVTAELSFLRSQVNPHFLFNAMNDIYSLTLTKSDDAPVAVLKLSELLRYMLREGTGELASLEREIDYLSNVVELWQIGEKGNSFVDFKVSGIIDNQQIAPLILINFVENAFKHGVTKDADHPVQIEVDVDASGLSFFISNKKNKDHKDSTVGIGLINVQRRLELIYPKSHHLEISDSADTFTINLRIEWI
ncbi:MAG: hypothetical protein EOO88_04320 [Pedobacter sp.]|nr:MAG: hypothetical protein EOO88_04320 [Pedobacter sp.]